MSDLFMGGKFLQCMGLVRGKSLNGITLMYVLPKVVTTTLGVSQGIFHGKFGFGSLGVFDWIKIS